MLDQASTIRVATTIPLPEGNAEFVTFSGLPDQREHIAVAYGDWRSNETPLVRVHSECLTGDVFGSLKCDCGPQLEEAQRLCSQDHGIILYLRQEGRGIGLYNKLDAYARQEQGADTWEANRLIGQPEEARDFTVAAHMLRALGKSALRLLTNNPDKSAQLQVTGIDVTEVIPTGIFPNRHNHGYLAAKQARGHALDLEE